jgi:hypothetical protein
VGGWLEVLERTCGRKKKLELVGAHWARGGRRDERRTHAEEKAALIEAGATEEEAEKALAAGREPPTSRRWSRSGSEHFEAFEIFCALSTQWRVPGRLLGGAHRAHLRRGDARDA